MNLDTKNIDRRKFVKGAVALGAVAALGATVKPTLRAFAAISKPVLNSSSNNSGEWKPTTCQGWTSCASVTGDA